MDVVDVEAVGVEVVASPDSEGRERLVTSTVGT
jgi:hypothetical protein